MSQNDIEMTNLSSEVSSLTSGVSSLTSGVSSLTSGVSSLTSEVSSLSSEVSSLSSVLIANRGEISSRISRTCKKMGIKSIAVFSDADRQMPFVKDADMAIYIGESAPSESYLNIDKIIGAALRSGAEGIHPGYGFLSENAEFARKCAAQGIVFIGPHPDAIDAMGSKSNAKTLMQKHDVPVVPGYQGKDQSESQLKVEAEKIGYPLLLKATAGGGGKGMRIVKSKKEISSAIVQAKRESLNAFGDDELILEKYIESGRHIEFQIFGDKHGHVIHLLERECTIQRRYQKVVEESPSPVMSAELRAKMGAVAVKAAKALNYDNAGTVEFIYDDKSGDFYFLEVNTRLQVEHPVTEEVTGLDLVQLQFESAQGKALSIKQEEVEGHGYAIEVRLYAEDANNNFMPVTGKVEVLDFPEVDGLRIESSIVSGSDISVYYDPMIAKIIVKDETREDTHRKMRYVLRNMACLGTTTNQPFLVQILEDSDFQKGEYSTHFIEKKKSQWAQNENEEVNSTLIAATLFNKNKRGSASGLLKSMPSGWRNSFYAYQFDVYEFGGKEVKVEYKSEKNTFHVKIEKKEYAVRILHCRDRSIDLEIDGMVSSYTVAKSKDKYSVHNENVGSHAFIKKDRLPLKEKEKIKGGYEAPMPSQVIKLLVSEGDKVKSGEGLLVLSSMKMENTIEASEDGTVQQVYVMEGNNVEAGTLLIKIE